MSASVGRVEREAVGQNPFRRPEGWEEQKHIVLKTIEAGLSLSLAAVSDAAACFRYRGLILCRVSVLDDDMLEGIVDQTYRMPELAHVPSIEAVRRLGLAPMKRGWFDLEWVDENGVERRERIEVLPLRLHSTKAYLFFVDGFWHLWSQASAARVSESGTNDFTTLLIAVIDAVRPEKVFAANLSRLIRSQAEGRRFAWAVTNRLGSIHAKGIEIKLRGHDAHVGFLLLQLMGWCAAMERDAIVSRMLVGRIAAWRRNEWQMGAGCVPFGYELVDNRLVPDLSKREQVEAMLLVLLSDAPVSQMARELDALGVRPLKASAEAGSAARTFSTMSSMWDSIRALYSWAGVWVLGEYVFRYSTSTTGLDDVAGLQVVRYQNTPEDMGEIQMLHRLDVPDGGWAAPEILEAFAAKAIAMTGAAAKGVQRSALRPLSDAVRLESSRPELHEHVLVGEYRQGTDKGQLERRAAARSKALVFPLAGRRWCDDEWLYEVRVGSARAHRLVRWPLAIINPEADGETQDLLGVSPRTETSQAQPDCHFSTKLQADSVDCQTVGNFSAQELMGGMVRALIEALREGIPASHMPARRMFNVGDRLVSIDARARQVEALQTAVAEAKREASQAARLAMRALDDNESDMFAVEARKASARAAAAETALADLRKEPEQVTPQAPFNALTHVWVPGLLALAGKEGRVTQAQANALDVVLVDFKLFRRDTIWWGTTKLRVETTEGVAELGPVEWRVAESGRGPVHVLAKHPARITVPGLMKRDLTSRLVDAGLSRLAALTAINSPFAELPHVLLHHLAGEPWPDFVGDDWKEPLFGAWVAKVYTGGTGRKFVNGKYCEFVAYRQLVVNDVAAAGSCGKWDHVRFVPTEKEATVNLSRSAGTGGKSDLPVWYASIRELEPTEEGARRFGPVICQCGEPAQIVARVAEVPRDLLCGACLRMPIDVNLGVPAELRFPPAYRLLQLSTDECLSELEYRLEKKREKKLSRRVRAILLRSDLLEEGARTSAFYELFGRGASSPLRSAECLGYVRSEYRNGETRRPHWIYTDDGRAMAAQLRAAADPPAASTQRASGAGVTEVAAR